MEVRARKLLALITVLVLVPVAFALGAPRKGPSLVVTSTSKVPASVKAGSAVQLTAKVKNKGRRKTRPSRLRAVLSKDARRDASDTALGGTIAVKALKKGKSVKVKGKLTVPRTAPNGTFTLLVCADACRAAGKVTVTGGRAPATRPSGSPAAAASSAPAGPPPARPSEATKDLPPAPGTKPGDPTDPQQPPPDPVPVDPAKIAPTLDPGASTSVYDATRFLFSGDNPIQRGVKAGAIDDDQVAVLKGRVTDRTGKAIERVRVSVVDHPEFGMTNTRADGAFDLAINGGDLVLQFEAAGFLTVQRTVAPDWQDYETMGDVVMVPVDPNVEVIEPESTEELQVVQGSPIEDQDGERQGTLLVETGTDATMELPDGSTKPVDELAIRVTEFTYGSQGDEAMPGSLPSTSGYTYAAEYSVDEALRAGAVEVRFDKPVVNYTENFIGAPVGSPVPTGYYDREKAEWVASENGVVIKVVNEVDGKAGVDVTGDGNADTGEPLTKLGIDEAERLKLAQLYDPGQELWRVLIKHFTPWDHNWPYGPPPGARPPKLKEFEWMSPDDPCQQKGSAIGCETQTLGESLPVTGTGMSLNYSTDRTPGWRVDEEIEIPITGAELPPRLKGIQLLIDVAGERIEKRWCDPSFPTQGQEACAGLPLPAANLTHKFRWDGLDAYDRRIQGRITATIKVLYIYEFNYYGADRDGWSNSFSQFGSDTEVFDGRGACGNRLMGLDAQFFCGVPVGQTITRAIGSWDARPTHGLGGWSLSEHHAYDPLEKALHRGDGATVRGEAMPAAVHTIVGTRGEGVGSGAPGEGSNFPTEGEPATEANIDYLTQYTRAPDGNLYLHNSLNRNHIFRVGRDEKTYHFAGNGTKGVISGDGGPAKSAALGTVTALAAEADGSLLVAGYTNTADIDTQVIRRVRPDGSRIDTIAGNTNRQGPFNDGKPALQAHVGDVQDLAVGPDGSIYWSEEYSATNGWKGRVRRIAPDGNVYTVAGGGTLAPENGNAAREVDLGNAPRGIAIGPDGSVYAALYFKKAVIRIAPDGRVFRYAGKGVQNERGDIVGGGQAASSYISNPGSLAVAPDGRLYIRSYGDDIYKSGSIILRVNGDGTLEHYAGRLKGTCGTYGVDGESAGGTCMQNHAKTLEVDGDGGVTYADGRYLIRKIQAPLPGFESDTLALPAADGSEVYEFDAVGRHLRTRDGLSGRVTRTFEYDGAKRLTGVLDAYGNRTTIERDGAGKATAIVAPGGQRTLLGITGAGWLETITNPANEVHRFTYHGDGGLLATYTRPEGGITRFDYAADGRLTKHRGPDGQERTLTRDQLDNGHRVTIETKAGRKTTYTMQVLANGDRRRTIVEPSGAETTSTLLVDGRTETVTPDNTRTVTELQPDPRWGSRAPVLLDQVITTPSGKKRRLRRDDNVSLRNRKDVFSVDFWSITTTESTPPATEGGSEPTEQSTWTYDAGTVENLDDQTATTETPEGRESVDTLDRFGRVTKSTLGRLPNFSNVAPMEYAYDAKGRIEKQKQGDQSWTFGYDAKNRLQSRTNAVGEAVTYTHDDADRVLTKTLPGGKVYRYEYDDDGVMTKLTTPRGKVHTFDATTGGRMKSYAPPTAAHEGPVGNPAQYLNTFSTENDLESVKLPSGAVQDFDDDAAGRSIAEDHVQTKRTWGYDGVRDQYGKVTRKLADGTGEQSIDFVHDGALPKSFEFTGAATGKAEFAFGGRLLPSEEKLTVGAKSQTRALEYDGDRLRTKDGPFTITRNGPLGAVSKITDGTGTIDFEFDASGRPTTRKLTVGGTEKHWQKLTIDKSLRGSQREERVAGGALDTLTFEYDAASQLKKVKRGAEVLEDFAYDDGGNRTSANGKAAAYDDQDRLTTRDGVVHKWDADGFLVKRGNDTFTWSRSGELLTATVGGATTTYAYDAFGRRTARTDAGGTTKYLYANPANVWQVTASVDASGALSTYFYDSDDRLYGIQRDSERFYVGTDPIGSPRVVVKSDGSVVRRVDYTAFGEERNATGSFDLPFGYAGGLRDGSTGLVRFGLRDYDPAAGRFVARDPSFFKGSPENLYAYVNNNPVTQKDPTGLVCGGWSLYAGIGGGFQLCRDNKWDAVEAQWSFCAEAGVGKGGGAEVDFAQGAQDPVTSIVAEATAKAGIFSATVGGELNLDCMQGKITGKANAGPVMIGASTADEITIGGAEYDNLGKWGAKVEAKVAAKKCWRW